MQLIDKQDKTSHAKDTLSCAPRLLDLKKAGEYLSISFWTVRNLVETGHIPVVRIPCPSAKDGRVIRRVLVDRVDLDQLVAKWKEYQ
jgi:hypothetical protein